MWIDRISFLTSNGSTGKAGRTLKVGLCLIWLVSSLTSCAQQSDLVKVEKDLGGKITKLDQEKKALAQVLKQAKQEIADALEQQTAELNEEIKKARAQIRKARAQSNDEIVKARAQLKSELRSLENEILPRTVNDLDTQLHEVRKNLENALKQQRQELSALKERREQREDELSNQTAALGQNLDQALKRQGQKVTDQFAAFQGSLGQFKQALTEVNTRLDQEGKRATSSETKIRQDFARHLQVFRAKLDADTQALKTYLETEVKTAIESINAALNEGNRILKTAIDSQAVRLSELNAQLGTKLNSQGKGLEQTAKQIEQLQGQYAALAQKLDADMKGLHGYLDKDVRPSLESIAKVFDQEKNRVSQEFIKVKSGFQRVEQTTASNVTQAQTQLATQAKHVQELSVAVAGMREVFDSMAGMLGNRTDQHMNQLGQLTARMAQLDKELSAETAKQSSNTQAVSTHLNEVTVSVQSVGQAFEQFKNTVTTRLNEQAKQLEVQVRQASESMKASSAVPSLQKGLKSNVTQLNELTKSVAQLKEVVRGMGKKLGSKVDAHESQLIEVEQALKKFQQPAPSKSRSPQTKK